MLHYIAQVWLVDTEDVEGQSQEQAEQQAVEIAKKGGAIGPSFIVAAHSYPWLLDMMGSKRWMLYEHLEDSVGGGEPAAMDEIIEQSMPIKEELAAAGVIVDGIVVDPRPGVEGVSP